MARFEQFLDPERVELEGRDGKVRVFWLSRLPALEGREVVLQYPASGLPKVGDYATNEAMMLKILARVAVEPTEGANPIPLETRALIDNHVPDWEMLIKLEGLMVAKNCSFFADGRASTFFAGLAGKAQELGIQMLTQSLGQLLGTGSPPSTN